jgi:glycosyltransferase involved in cell wall biosynthesis
MKIVHVLAGNEDGGLEKHVIELTLHLALKGFDISVVAHEKFRMDFDTVTFIPLDLSKGRLNPIILFQLRHILVSAMPDIVHTHANKATFMVNLINILCPFKVISTLHSEKRNIRAFEKSDYVITVSNKIGKDLRRVPKITIYNGMSLPTLKPISLHERYGIPQNTFILCAIGRLVHVKRFDILIKSLENLDVHLMLIGDGYEKTTLMSLSETLKINHKISFLGALGHEETLCILSHSDLAVMSSEREGFPYTFVEAMLCKTPFLSTPVSDIEEFISSNYIFPINDVTALRDKIIFIHQNYSTVVNDFHSIFNHAIHEFSIDTMVQKTCELYQKVSHEC